MVYNVNPKEKKTDFFISLHLSLNHFLRKGDGMAIRILYLTGQDDLPIHNVSRLQTLSIHTLKNAFWFSGWIP